MRVDWRRDALSRRWFVAAEQFAQVAIAESVDGELATNARLPAAGRRVGERIQYPPAATLADHGAADRGGQLGHRGLVVDRRQGLQIPLVGLLTDLGGWDLVRTSLEATLDNTANAEEFQLVLNDDFVTVSARSLKDVRSDYPLLVEFDDGNGNEPVRKQLAHGTTYTVGINQDTGLWDLFAGDAAASGAGEIDDIRILASAGLLSASGSIAIPAKQ